MNAAAKRYMIGFGGAMIGYMVVLIGAVTLLESREFGVVPTALLALAPVVPALFALREVFIFVRRMDEFQRRIVTEAFIGAALIIGLASFAYGFLEGALELPVIPMIWILPAIIGLYGVLTCVLKYVVYR
jgi:hypothetical protein